MDKKFKFENRSHLESNIRKRLLPARKTLLKLGLNKGDAIADIGSGTGYFTFSAAKIVGKGNTVYALDISTDMLSVIENKVLEEKISNIKTIVVTEDSFDIDSDTIDFAFICSVLHEIDNLDLTLKEIKRIIKTSGKLAIIEWKKIKSNFGPPINHRLEPLVIINKLHKIGFKKIEQSDINNYLYSITCFK